MIDNMHSGMRRRGRATRWRDGSLAVRWAAASFLSVEKSYRRIVGNKDLGCSRGTWASSAFPPVDRKEVTA